MVGLNTIRLLVTLLSLAAFIAIVAWAYAPRNRQAMQAAAGIPFAGTEAAGQAHHGTTEPNIDASPRTCQS